MMTRNEAQTIFNEWVDSKSLRRHCISVALVMEAYASHLGEDVDKWWITGLLHDADYEKFPDQHPNLIVKRIAEAGDAEISHAISAHHTGWGVKYETLLDKYLLAVDELTGFIIAVCLMRPARIDGLTPTSVKKKLKTRGFAAGVDRDEISKGIEIAGIENEAHMQFIISVLEQHKEELDLLPITPDSD